MNCTEQELIDEIKNLRTIVRDIRNIAFNMEQGVHQSSLSILEKKGMLSFIEDTNERVDKFCDRCNTLVKFTLCSTQNKQDKNNIPRTVFHENHINESADDPGCSNSCKEGS